MGELEYKEWTEGKGDWVFYLSELYTIKMFAEEYNRSPAYIRQVMYECNLCKELEENGFIRLVDSIWIFTKQACVEIARKYKWDVKRDGSKKTKKTK